MARGRSRRPRSPRRRRTIRSWFRSEEEGRRGRNDYWYWEHLVVPGPEPDQNEGDDDDGDGAEEPGDGGGGGTCSR